MRLIHFFLTLLFTLPLALVFYGYFKNLKHKAYQERIAQFMRPAPMKSHNKKAVKNKNAASSTALHMRIVLLFALVLLLKKMGLSWLFIGSIEGAIICLLYTIPRRISLRQRAQLVRNLPSCIDYISRSIISGANLSTAFMQVGESDLKAAPLFREIHQELTLGKPFEEVLKKKSTEYKNNDLSFCLSIFITQHQTGRHDARALEHLAKLLRKKIDIQNKLASSTSEASLTGYILAAGPLLLALIMLAVSPSYIKPLFDTELGRTLIWSALIMNAVGLLITKKMAQIKF